MLIVLSKSVQGNTSRVLSGLGLYRIYPIFAVLQRNLWFKLYQQLCQSFKESEINIPG